MLRDHGNKLSLQHTELESFGCVPRSRMAGSYSYFVVVMGGTPVPFFIIVWLWHSCVQDGDLLLHDEGGPVCERNAHSCEVMPRHAVNLCFLSEQWCWTFFHRKMGRTDSIHARFMICKVLFLMCRFSLRSLNYLLCCVERCVCVCVFNLMQFNLFLSPEFWGSNPRNYSWDHYHTVLPASLLVAWRFQVLCFSLLSILG